MSSRVLQSLADRRDGKRRVKLRANLRVQITYKSMIKRLNRYLEPNSVLSIRGLSRDVAPGLRRVIRENLRDNVSASRNLETVA